VEAKNPQRNYARALEEIKIYLSLSPEEAHTIDVQNWLAVLSEIDHLRTDKIELGERNRALHATNEKIKETNKNLRDEVVGLKETIGKLNYLDRQLEEKRKLIK
jgi:cell division protein FtsB